MSTLGVLLIFLFSAFAFSDSSGHLNETAINYLQENDIVSGYSDGTYRPDNQINRAEFLKIILESLNIEFDSEGYCFPDVQSDWYAPYVCKAKSIGIISGYPDGYFRPGNKINLVESLKIILEAYDVSLNYGYSEWYEPYYYFMQDNELLMFVNTTISHEITRGEMAQLIYNLDNFYNKELVPDANSSAIYFEDALETRFLIITSESFKEPAKKLASVRDGEMTTRIFLVENISGDIIDWLKNFYTSHSSLKYVLLLGDTSIIPTFYSDSPLAEDPVSTDFPYTLHIDYEPQLAVGRIPAENLEELNSWYNKLLAYEENMISDHDFLFFGNTQDFDAYTYNQIEPVEDEGYNVIQAKTDIPNPIANYLNAGAAFSAFYGHGSLLSFASIFSVDDLYRLNNSEKPTVLFSGGCDTVNYSGIVKTITERLVTNFGNGAVAAMGATKYGGFGYDYQFVPSFIANCQNGRLGDAFNFAVIDNHELVMSEDTWTGDGTPEEWADFFSERMSLLGDPTMNICR